MTPDPSAEITQPPHGSAKLVSFRGHGDILLRAESVRGQGTPHGDLPPIVLLHGGGQTRHSWRATVSRLANGGWDVIIFDARGHGESAWASDGDYSLDAFITDLSAIVSELDRPPVLVGASLGGMTALVGAGEGVLRIAGLVLVDVAPRIEPRGRARIHDFMSAAPFGFESLEQVRDAVHAYNPGRPAPKSLDGLRRNVRLGADGRWRWHWDPAFLQINDEPTRLVDERRLQEAATRIEVPTLLIRGTHSDIVTVEGAAELLNTIPGSELAEAPAGHMVAGDDNDVFSASLLDFLSRRIKQNS